MREIPLTQGKVALVDADMFEELNKFNWHAFRSGRTYYAARNTRDSETGKAGIMYMHREILNTPVGFETDHYNWNGLDNRRANLRVATKSQNQHNHHPRKGTSRFKGVDWNKSEEKWQVRIRCAGKRYHLGLFASEIDAARAYNRKAAELFGEFARLNEI